MRQPFLYKMVPQLAHSLEFLVAGSGLLLPLDDRFELVQVFFETVDPGEESYVPPDLSRWGSLDIRLGSQASILHSAFSQQIQRPLVPQASLQEE